MCLSRSRFLKIIHKAQCEQFYGGTILFTDLRAEGHVHVNGAKGFFQCPHPQESTKKSYLRDIWDLGINSPFEGRKKKTTENVVGKKSEEY